MEKSPTSERARAFREGLLVFLATLLVMGFFQTRPGLIEEDSATRLGVQSRSLPMGDSSFHIRTAYLYRTGDIAAAGSEFHWLRPTIWGERYVDKEFLYHLYLVPFTLGAREVSDTSGLIWGAKFATSLLFALLALTLWGVLRGLGVRHAWAFTALMFLLGGPLFCARTHETRSWPAGLIVALAAFYAMAKNRRLDLLLLACVYTLTYAAVHFLAMLWFVRAAVSFAYGAPGGSTRGKDLKQNLLQLAALLSGIALGVVLHPGRSHFIETWIVQYVLVPTGAMQGPLRELLDGMLSLLGMSSGITPELVSRMLLGTELAPVHGSMTLFGLGAASAAAIGLPFVSAILRHRPSREAVIFGAMGLMTMAMCVSSMRFAELMGPFVALAFGVWANELVHCRIARRFANARPALARRLGKSLLAACVAGGVAMMAYIIQSAEHPVPRPWRDAALWLRDNPQARGKLVYNQSWDMFSELIFYAPTSDFTSGMDPFFLLAADPEKSKLYWDNHHGTVDATSVDRTLALFKPDYILIAPQISPAFEAELRKAVDRGQLRVAFDDPNFKVTLYEVVR